jgi:hypothetical protein
LPLGELQIGDTNVIVGLSDLPLATRTVWLVGAAMVAIVALLLLPAAFRSDRDGLVVLSTSRKLGMVGGGSLAVSSRSLHALATYRAEAVPGVLEAFTRMRLKRKGWQIDLQVVLSPKCEVQAVGNELRTAMNEALRSHTGYPIARLRIWAQLDPLSKKQRVY